MSTLTITHTYLKKITTSFNPFTYENNISKNHFHILKNITQTQNKLIYSHSFINILYINILFNSISYSQNIK